MRNKDIDIYDSDLLLMQWNVALEADGTQNFPNFACLSKFSTDFFSKVTHKRRLKISMVVLVHLLNLNQTFCAKRSDFLLEAMKQLNLTIQLQLSKRNIDL
ncbi:hypothetical protein XENOCAPTIV_030606 [Xenoophorus captivus]|uniref:Uncharacterized protein n=1 Tax=Xenoophorus captivus TaxID=1517983 RepID=A0ABV0QNX0_9TELE